MGWCGDRRAVALLRSSLPRETLDTADRAGSLQSYVTGSGRRFGYFGPAADPCSLAGSMKGVRMFGFDILARTIYSAMIAALVAGLNNDPGIADGYVSLSIRNSHIEIKTKRIDRVVAIGTVALRPLIH